MNIEKETQEQPQDGLTQEQVAFLDNERELHHSGVSKSYSWEETKAFIRGEKTL
jgi:hypothetical protein